MPTCVHACMCTCVCVHACVHECVYVCTCVCMVHVFVFESTSHWPGIPQVGYVRLTDQCAPSPASAAPALALQMYIPHHTHTQVFFF